MNKMDNFDNFQSFADIFEEDEMGTFEVFAGLITPSIRTMFVLAGKSYFTLVNKDTGEELVFKVYQLFDDTTQRHVVVRDGKSFRHIGIIYMNILSRPFLRNDINSPFGCWFIGIQLFENFWYKTSRDLPMYDVEMYHAGRCARCGRPLTLEISIERGFGPVCFKKTTQMMKDFELNTRRISNGE